MKIRFIFSTFMYCTALSFFFSTQCMNKHIETCVITPFSDLIKNENTIKLDTIFSHDTDYIKEQINNLTSFSILMKKAENDAKKDEVTFNLKLIETSAKKHYRKKIKQREKKTFAWGLGLGGGIGLGIGILLTYFSPLVIKKEK